MVIRQVFFRQLSAGREQVVDFECRSPEKTSLADRPGRENRLRFSTSMGPVGAGKRWQFLLPFELSWFGAAALVCALEPAWPAEIDGTQAVTGLGVSERQLGFNLAHQYCAACHLFPEPDLLDKQTWATGALRKMAPYLGVAQLHFEGRPDGARLEASHRFPPSPLVTQAEWNAIRTYYVRTAPETALPQSPRGEIARNLAHFTVEKLVHAPWPPLTTLVHIEPGRHEVTLGDAATSGLLVFGSAGRLLREIPLRGVPVGLVMDGNRTLATLIGQVFPSDVPEGRVVVLPSGMGAPRDLLSELERPTSCVVADLNGDGRSDLVVCSFGNYLGRLSWFEQKVDGRYEEHVLLDSPGAIRAEVRDVDADGRPDLIVLMAQGNEGLFLFTNLGQGEFGLRVLLRFHPVFGSTSFELADMNGDGFPDVILTNGDNGEYPSPFKRYHGVRIFLNDGKYNFTEAWFYPLNGAFKVVARDFDGDGDLDLAVISFFPDYSRSPEEGFVYLRNDGAWKFSAQSFPGVTLGRWLTMDAGDLDGDGAIDLVLGAFSQGPPGVVIPAELQTAWRTNGVAGVILHNTLPIRRKAP